MKLRSLVIRLIVLWIPVLPPTPLIARQQREVSSIRSRVHMVVATEARHTAKVSVINHESVIVERNSGG